MRTDKDSIRPLLRTAGIVLALGFVAFAIEFFAFGLDSLETSSYSKVEPTACTTSDLSKNPEFDAADRFTMAREYDFEFEPIGNVHFIDQGIAPGDCATIYVKDEGHEGYCFLGEIDISSAPYVRIHPYGNVNAIKIVTPKGAENSYDVEFNVPQPLDFNFRRAAALFTIFLLGACLVSRSALLRAPATRRYCVAVSLIAAVAAGAMVFAYHVDYPLVGAPQHHEYHQLAVALSHGSFALDDLPPAEFATLSNPYDLSARGEVPYYWDHAYFEGKYYVYFGVLPVLLYHLPYYLVTGLELPEWVGVALSSALFVLGAFFLVWTVAKARKLRLERIELLSLALVVLLGSFIAFALCNSDIYTSPIALGLALTVWGTALWLRAVACDGISLKAGVVGSFCMASVVLCRPQLLLYSLVGPFLLAYAKLHLEKDIQLRHVVAFVAPYAVLFALAGFYNFARFGSVLDFGANYNLTTNDMTHRPANLQLLWQGLFAYLIQPVLAAPQWPFIFPTVLDMGYYGQVISQATYGGILFLCPLSLMLVVFACGGVRKRYGRWAIAGTAMLILIGCVLAGFDAIGAGLLQRYYLDFSLAFALAVLLLCTLNSDLPKNEGAGRIYGTLFALLLVASYVNQVLIFL